MTLYLKPLPAHEVIERMCSLAAKVFPNRNINLVVDTHAEGVRLTTGDQASASLATFPTVQSFAKGLAERDYVSVNTASIRDQPNRTITYSCNDQVAAVISFAGAGGPDEAIAWLTATAELFDLAPINQVMGGALAGAERTAIQIRERASADLQAGVSRLTEALSNLSIQDAEARRRLQEELEKHYLARSNELDSNYLQKQTALGEERLKIRGELEKKEADHTARVAAFNTNEAIYVRRAQADKLTEILTAESVKLELSKETGAKRRWVHGFTWLMLATSAGLAWAILNKVLGEDKPAWNHSLPLLGATVTFFATLIYYLKWNDSWFRQHAEGELASRRYRADMMRASWLAELVSERSKADQAPWPPEILEALTRNLFRDVTPMSATEHPLEQLSSLMKRAKEIKIGTGRLSLKTDSDKEGKD